jgi:hypothetical protein
LGINIAAAVNLSSVMSLGALWEDHSCPDYPDLFCYEKPRSPTMAEIAEVNKVRVEKAHERAIEILKNNRDYSILAMPAFVFDNVLHYDEFTVDQLSEIWSYIRQENQDDYASYVEVERISLKKGFEGMTYGACCEMDGRDTSNYIWSKTLKYDDLRDFICDTKNYCCFCDKARFIFFNNEMKIKF